MTSPRRSRSRILCLHGGGTNSRIFKHQCRALIRGFDAQFRLVFAEAPWPTTTPGPDVLSVYTAHGPYKVWLPETSAVDDGAVIEALENSLRRAMSRDDEAGFKGPWVGLLGFSQGAKMAASILYETQRGGAFAGVEWQFGVLFAARAPLVALHEACLDEPVFDRPTEVARVVEPNAMHQNPVRLRLVLPSVHVHGLLDPNLALHQVMLDDYCKRDRVELVQWSGAHRMPIRDEDVKRVLEAIGRVVTVSEPPAEPCDN